ncbi:hypothetical protein B4N84_08390 [Flavobacterium sp. IR1]|nr:hypothetical protein B4N84_08390 [Flavobacterium sp. IR1]
MDGNDNPRVDGYSKELNNYKTIILFEKQTTQDNLSIDKNGSLQGFVWYREGINFAIPANKQDKKFPLKKYIYKNLKIPILWLFVIILTFIIYKISKNSTIFKTNNNEENN